jgi:hypothetical protein
MPATRWSNAASVPLESTSKSDSTKVWLINVAARLLHRRRDVNAPSELRQSVLPNPVPPSCGQKEKFLRLDQILHPRVIGQDEALPAGRQACKPSPTPSSAPVLFCLRPSAFSLPPPRPIGSFILLGPTGVGKTELARAL